MGARARAGGASPLWIALFTAASTATTLALACATPFPSLAALAAVHMRRRDGIALMLAAWLASQAVGLLVLGYPRTAETWCWGAGLGSAVIVALLGADAALRWSGGARTATRLALAYGGGFVAFKLVILVWALFIGGVATALAPALLAEQLLRNGAILIGLYGLYRGLVALGIPPARPARAAA